MKPEQQLLYMNKNYKIISVEQEYIIHPTALNLIPLSYESMAQNFTAAYQVKDYQLYLNQLTLFSNKPTSPISRQEEDKVHSFEEYKMFYNGAVLIGCDLVKEYCLKDNEIACFSYQKVYELIFEDGLLITTIDHSKAMLRIRKNLELGLRILYKKNDKRCIKRFINSSFVGDYKPYFLKQTRYRYLAEMKDNYANTGSLKQIPSIE